MLICWLKLFEFSKRLTPLPICNPFPFTLQVNVHIWDMHTAGLSQHMQARTKCFLHLRKLHYSCQLLIEHTQNLTGLPLARFRLLGTLRERAPSLLATRSGKVARPFCKACILEYSKAIPRKKMYFFPWKRKMTKLKIHPGHFNSAMSKQCRLCILPEPLS